MPKSKVSKVDLQALLVRLKRLMRHAWKHFSEDRCFEEAASLGYTSLLAMVPLLAVIFGVVAAFPVFSEWSNKLRSFIFTNFVPAASGDIETYLNTFLASVSGLTLPGTVFLILTALLLMFRIEVAFNRIWRVDRSRTVMNRVVMYWAVLTLGPVLIGGAIALSAQNIFRPLGLDGMASPALHRMGVFVLQWMMFTLLFLLVPNRPVRIGHAMVGALLSALLFEIAKAGFVAYISNANYAVIYGALATLPIFLFWLYLIWIVILFGASLSASLTTFADSEKELIIWPDKLDFQLVFRLVGHLWVAQRAGEKRSDTELMALEPHANNRQVQHLLRQMEVAKIVGRAGGENWVLLRDLEELQLSDLYGSGSHHLPRVDVEVLPVESEWDRVFARVMKEVMQHGLARMDQPLRPLYQRGADQGEGS